MIYRYGMTAIVEKLSEFIGIRNVHWSQVSEAEISIVSAETAKGLEFDTVVATTADMSFNEQYVTISRAIDNLVVINDICEDSFVDEGAVQEGPE